MDESDDMLVDKLKEVYAKEWVPLKGMRCADESARRAMEGWVRSMQ